MSFFTINESNKVVSRVDEELSCPAHEEAVTKAVYHACNINYQAEIVTRSIDTEIAAIMLGNMHPLKMIRLFGCLRVLEII
ncbi:uncharacterized protein TNCV_207701 [Trichonephila clavipes]|nr:uncharacterized protein TNCV_207701 [Trichonephila clavipes]